MRRFPTGWRRYVPVVALVGASFGVMGAQCQPVKPPAPTGLTMSPKEQDFGTDSADGASGNFHFFTVTNHGPGTTGRIDSTMLGGDASQFDATHPSAPGMPGGACPGAVLAPSESCTQQVFFNPTTTGAKSSTLIVTADPGGTVTAHVTGNGIP